MKASREGSFPMVQCLNCDGLITSIGNGPIGMVHQWHRAGVRIADDIALP
jgi:hypothetical protein